MRFNLEKTSSVVESSFQPNGDSVSRLLGDRLAHVGLDRQLMSAISQRHEGTAERMAIDRAANLHKAAGTKGTPPSSA